LSFTDVTTRRRLRAERQPETRNRGREGDVLLSPTRLHITVSNEYDVQITAQTEADHDPREREGGREREKE